ncbi:hypothetical protein EK904_009169, partial [Melospiza melodia maxima]
PPPLARACWATFRGRVSMTKPRRPERSVALISFSSSLQRRPLVPVRGWLLLSIAWGDTEPCLRHLAQHWEAAAIAEQGDFAERFVIDGFGDNDNWRAIWAQPSICAERSAHKTKVAKKGKEPPPTPDAEDPYYPLPPDCYLLIKIHLTGSLVQWKMGINSGMSSGNEAFPSAEQADLPHNTISAEAAPRHGMCALGDRKIVLFGGSLKKLLRKTPAAEIPLTSVLPVQIAQINSFSFGLAGIWKEKGSSVTGRVRQQQRKQKDCRERDELTFNQIKIKNNKARTKDFNLFFQLENHPQRPKTFPTFVISLKKASNLHLYKKKEQTNV